VAGREPAPNTEGVPPTDGNSHGTNSRSSLPTHSPDADHCELTRQELLAAIDSEIAQRQGATTQHGISVWGLAVAVVALLWASVSEITERTHNWTNAALVFFAAWWFLTNMVFRFTHKIRWI